ncbi:MAG TPA: EamA family transporter [Ktedonobacteraceae bacterium]|nr:EamA family transporter [Ktedonobacteraceae bacterium]
MQLTQRKSSFIVVLNYVLMVLIWGSFPVAAKIGVQHAPPLLLSGVRFTLAFLIMAPFAYWQSKKLWITWRQHLRVLLISILMVGIPSSIFFAATPHAPVSVLTIMWSTTPIFTALFAMRDRDEVHGWKLPVSLLIGLTGVLIVLVGRLPFLPGPGGDALFVGSGIAIVSELAVLASSSIYGYGIRMARRKSPDIPVTVMTAWQIFYCGIFLLSMSLIFERGASFQPTWITFGALFYLAIFCSCISFFLTFWLIRRIGAIRTAYSDFIIPGITLILSYLFVGESLTVAKVIGLVFVILGVVLVQIP